ncbi:protein-arginine deiminase type-4-like, partial [Fukomys damarensis]|uniref:protein-arginine deiminase type-4-like n=1 Tax=Fukomys damarensis TaxID=885580 RepID=UPI0014557876
PASRPSLAPTFLPPFSSPQSCIDWNREVLRRELGLEDPDIIDIPQLFKLTGGTRGALKAEAFFPNMLSQLPGAGGKDS